MNICINLLQQVNIEEKIKDAPDRSYEIGVFIGAMLPFLVLVTIAYIIYYFNKKKNQ
ncbi:hypothetical protein Q4566_13255 [Tamlana sp. 2_MG-2023]|uniref:hypothetical protein n=1 Tax=unclassified Tamlana TaxID=2614803 RepID=UPI0026E49618|nr:MULTISPECIES: hypothetical protein [unclassified Tamlana]MDO6761172.1 hypothetical protein [Tamlana sp. 2_MG-2023]MDO6791495.1 hypothetical protein [Tamlana sp. 1_MG-2023]